jgi:hypothetical protein
MFPLPEWLVIILLMGLCINAVYSGQGRLAASKGGVLWAQRCNKTSRSGKKQKLYLTESKKSSGNVVKIRKKIYMLLLRLWMRLFRNWWRRTQRWRWKSDEEGYFWWISTPFWTHVEWRWVDQCWYSQGQELFNFVSSMRSHVELQFLICR